MMCTFREFRVNLSVELILYLCTSCAFLVHFRILCDFFCALFCFLLCTLDLYVIFGVHFCVFSVILKCKEITEHFLHFLHLSAIEKLPMMYHFA